MLKDIHVTATNMSKLINEAFMDCLFKEGEDTTNNVKVEGVVNTFGLHPGRLEEKRELVTALINELPEEFKEGYSFLSLYVTKDGEQWTSLHSDCEQLIVMAIGLGLMNYCLPRELWKILPGGVPYVIIN